MGEVIVNNPVDDHGLYFGPPRHAKCCHLGADKLTDVRNVPVLVVNLVVISVILALNWGSMGFFYICR